MRYIFPIIILALGLLSCKQEISPEQADRFIKFYGNALMDEAKDVAVLDDGSYAICGTDSLSGEGKRGVLIVTDEYGNVKPDFPRYYSEGSLNTGINSMVVMNGGEGGFLLVGYVEKPSGDSTQRDIFLVRIRKSGSEIDRKSLGTDEDETVLYASEIFPSDDGTIPSTGFILAGYKMKDGKRDIMVMGVDDALEPVDISLNYFSGGIENSMANFIYTTGENYLVACTYDKLGGDGTDLLVLVVTDDLSATPAFLGGDNDEVARCIEHVENDMYLVLANRVNDSGYSEIILHRIEVSSNAVVRSDLVATISDAGADLDARRIRRLADGSYAIVGTREQQGNQDIFVQFLDEEYSVGMRQLFSASGNQRGADLDYTGDGGLVILGTNGDGNSSMISLIKTGNEGEL